MATLTVTAPTVISPCCGCWPAIYVRTESGDIARCSECAEPTVLSCDIEPNLEDGERLVWIEVDDDLGTGSDALAYFTEAIEEGDES